MGKVHRNTHSQIPDETIAAEGEQESTQGKVSQYDDPFYDNFFGAIDGPHDMSARSGETYREIMDNKYRQHAD